MARRRIEADKQFLRDEMAEQLGFYPELRWPERAYQVVWPACF
jgi:hypothetical protein